MKQSVDLIRSMKPYSFRQNNMGDRHNNIRTYSSPEKTRVNSNHVLSYLKSLFELTHLFWGVNYVVPMQHRSVQLLHSQHLLRRICNPMPSSRGFAIPTSLIRRVLMLLVVMVMSVGSAWGEEVEIWSGTHTSSYWQITADKFSSATTSDALRVYVSSPGDI